MTAIERLWNRAKSDPVQQEINDALADGIAICILCGDKTILDRVSGCYTCEGCDDKVCGDG